MSGNDKFRENIKKQQKRKIEARKNKDRGLWFGLGMFGLVGWSVSIPTLIFLAIGIWLDTKLNDQVSWTLMFLVLGVVVGCLNAWYWVKKESQND